jgi:hypothetical protein
MVIRGNSGIIWNWEKEGAGIWMGFEIIEKF